jgi:multidrug efflux pump subunit AcrA (membrane-fusion protein)
VKTVGRRSKILIITLAITGLGSASLYGGYRAWTATGGEARPLTMVIEPRDFTLSISANGELQSAESLAIAVPPVPVHQLRIASVIPDGRRVEKGDVLVEFDRTELDLQALEHNYDLEMADQKLSRGELSVGAEKTDIIKDKKVAELELNKIREFLPKNEEIFSRRQIVEGQLDESYTAKRIVFADGRLELKGKVYSLSEAILLLERQKAQSKIQQVDKALTSLKLLSPASGVVVYNDPGFFFGGHSLMPGRVVYIGMTLFNLVNPNNMESKFFVLEKDAGELRTGQSVNITLDPYPGIEVTGKVKSIDKVARPIDRDSPIKYFQTIVSIDKTDPAIMKPGVKLKARIIAGELKSAIVIPRSAVVKKDSDFVVYAENGPAGFDEIPVKLGQGDLIQVTVTEGLSAGRVIALNPPDLKREQKKTAGSSAAGK